VNFGTPVPLLIGIVLILGAVALFFLDKLKPGYGRDSDKVYAVLWLISGVFLLGHLTMELLASFQQLIMTGMLIAITLENIYSRKPKEDRYAASGVGDGSSREDYYRPSRPRDYRSSSPRMNVRAELDNEDPYRPRFPEDRRMLRGRDEPRRRPDYYGDDYPDRYSTDRDSERPMPAPERSVERLNPSSDRIRRRRPKAIDNGYGAAAPPNRGWDESATGYAANSGGYSAHADNYGSGPASSGYSPMSDRDEDSYVDYKPVKYPNEESEKPSSDYGSRY
jgi:hypothetical protein